MHCTLRKVNAQSGEGRFASTHWSVVFAAAKTQSTDAHEALSSLCATYWYPLYAFLRRKGYTSHEAEDFTQEFFARRVVTKQIFRGINATEGRFRTWLLNSLQNFLRNQYDRKQAQKRGGGQPHLSLDFKDAEGRYVSEPTHNCTPERAYERSWAMTLLDRALTRLQHQYNEEGKAALFTELKSFLPGAFSGRSYAELASRTGKSEAALKMAVSRLRQQYGQILKAEIKRTVSRPEEEKEEIQHLLKALES